MSLGEGDRARLEPDRRGKGQGIEPVTIKCEVIVGNLGAASMQQSECGRRLAAPTIAGQDQASTVMFHRRGMKGRCDAMLSQQDLGDATDQEETGLVSVNDFSERAASIVNRELLVGSGKAKPGALAQSCRNEIRRENRLQLVSQLSIGEIDAYGSLLKSERELRTSSVSRQSDRHAGLEPSLTQNASGIPERTKAVGHSWRVEALDIPDAGLERFRAKLIVQ
ncbi:MAG: hypothetical protein H5U40_03245 [Polyangiaceae bacterium]|nr:hypothetical protein [Polyangiaceae bacterium]